MLDQVDGDIEMAAAQREINRPRAVKRIRHIDVGATFHQDANNLEMAAFSGKAQRADAIFCRVLHGGTGVKQRDHACPIARTRRFEQRLGPIANRLDASTMDVSQLPPAESAMVGV